jgi:hypothetical protein
LLEKLDALARDHGCAAESLRRSRVLEELNQLRSNSRPRRLPAPPRPSPNGASLPAGVALPAPGQISITFTSPEELLGRLLALAQAASQDFTAFAAALEEGPQGAPASSQAPPEGATHG